MQFNINHIQSMADPRSFSRGLDYFKKRKVEFVEYDNSSQSYFAEVKGSGRNTYALDLYFDGKQLRGECDCPVAFNCKHTVAAALQVLQENPRGSASQKPIESATPLQQWLAQLPVAANSEPKPPAYGSHYLLYFLEILPSGARISTKKAYLKKDNTWSQVSHYAPEHSYPGWHRPAFLRDEDVTILQLLPRSPFGGQLAFSGEQGGLALKHLLPSGRLYSGKQQLCTGPARNLEWQWHEEGGRVQLGAQLEGIANWEMIPVSPPHYLNADTGEVGQIATPLGGAQLKHLLTMPKVSTAELGQTALQLRRVIPREHLPLPVEPELTAVDTFTPCITLVTCHLSGFTLPGLKLHFDYAGFPLEPPYSFDREDENPVRERDGQYFEIKRDTSAEYRCCDQVHEQGLYLCQEELGGQRDVWVPDADGPEQALAHWRQLVEHKLPILTEQGWKVETDPDYRFDVKQTAFSVRLDDAHNNWFDFALNLPLDNGQSLDTTEVIEHWLEQKAPDELILHVQGEWVSVDTRPLQNIRGLITDLFNQKKLGKPVRLPAFQAAQFEDVPDLDQRKAPLTRKLMRELRDFTGLRKVPAPAGLNAKLRDYQKAGLNWLVFLQRYGFGGILADDMGLGKTLQTLALIQHLKNSGKLAKPALIVAPTSLTGNWMHEAARFTPDLETTLIHGPNRDSAFRKIAKSDLVITTYPLLARDKARYKKRQFSLMVLDEAQAVKNPNTKTAECVREINSQTRLCLTGTPLENHLGELWALMDFALPGLLGGRKSFNDAFRNPIEREADGERQRELARKVAPFMLRRTKSEVVKELPPKTETVQYVELGGKQRALYESVRISMEKRIRELVARQGMARSHIEFLDALLKLRQACIDPRLVKLDKAANIKESAKLEWLAETLPQLLEEGRNILIFSQFTQVLKLIEAQLKALKVDYSKLTGQTRKRQEAIDRFQNGEVRVFLISLKAGGSGLNLTAADVVIHMDPWWNPAVENQATDRAHRIGQDKPVFVYKLVAAETVEERITQMQQEKQALADSLFSSTKSAGMPADKGDLLALLAE